MFRLIAFLESNSRWDQLRLLGSSNLVRASVLMPAFGYMLLLNENVHQYLTVKYDGWILAYLPSVWRVWFLFYGSFALALATILYSLFCPRPIKTYGSEYEMAAAETEYHCYLDNYSRTFLTVESLYDGMTASEQSLLDLEPFDFSKKRSEYTEQERAQIAAHLIHSWSIRNIHHPKLRSFIFIMFATGMVLVGIPAIWTIVQVTVVGVYRVFH